MQRFSRNGNGRGLTDKQVKFIQEYPKDLNATQAAIRAGYSRRTARHIGAQNLAKLNIQEALQSEFDQRAKRTHITQDLVLSELWQVYRDTYLAHVWPSTVRALELLGKHVGLFGPKGTEDDPLHMQMKMIEELDLTRLTDEELHDFIQHSRAIRALEERLALPPAGGGTPDAP